MTPTRWAFTNQGCPLIQDVVGFSSSSAAQTRKKSTGVLGSAINWGCRFITKTSAYSTRRAPSFLHLPQKCWNQCVGILRKLLGPQARFKSLACRNFPWNPKYSLKLKKSSWVLWSMSRSTRISALSYSISQLSPIRPNNHECTADKLPSNESPFEAITVDGCLETNVGEITGKVDSLASWTTDGVKPSYAATPSASLWSFRYAFHL